MERKSGSGLPGLVRECYRHGGYVFARRAVDVARESGLSRIARLASNENPRPPAALAVSMGSAALKEANRYPDDRMTGLTDALRDFHGDFSFVTGVGMDGVIETVIRTLVNPGEKVAVSVPTFSFYNLASTAQGALAVEIPRSEDFSVDVDRFIEKSGDAKISFLCTPNNPTGTVTAVRDVEEILSRISGILFLDNAYVEFSGMDYRPLMRKFDNLILGRTFSKVFSLAGLRVGYAFVPEWLLPYYQRAATPFTLNSVSAAAAVGALRDSAHLQETVIKVQGWRERIVRECRYPVYPSGANFVMVDVSPATGREIADALASRGVLVRSCESFPGLKPRFIRVSIGEDWEMEKFLTEIHRL